MPDTREKLIELLEDRRLEASGVLGSMNKGFGAWYADHLIANGVTVQQWIPVTERLPALHIDEYEEPDGSWTQFEESDDQWVITASNHQTKARYETGVVFQGWVGEHGITVHNVTHWMPLPQPPKEPTP